jgi:hypothetical protein
MNGERGSVDVDDVEIQTGAGVSAALVAGLVVVHLAMAYSISTLPDLVHDLVEPLAGDSTALLVVDLLPLLPLALVVLGVARTLPRGVLACAIVLAAALLGHALVGSWGVAPLLTFGAALAWGVARRDGLWWYAGLVLAPALALLVRWIDPNPFLDHVAVWASFRAFFLHVVPGVVAGLACWALDWWEQRR